MNRRDALRTFAAGAAVSTIRTVSVGLASEIRNTGLGLVIYTLALRRRALQAERPKRDLFEPLSYLDYCRSLGVGGVQVPLGVRETGYCQKLRDLAGQHGMFVEGIVNMPKDDRDLERFAAEVHTAAQVGARVLRTTTLPGRRYEQFTSWKEYLAAAEQSRRWLQRVVPILERDKVRLAIENHKDRRADEFVALLRGIGSPYVGACVDLGNNFALLEDPVVVVETLAPWAFSVHIKDQAVQEYDDGFLFADVPLGEGILDLKKMVETLRRAQPDVHFNLETIIRDPLRVPVLTDKYWATFPDVCGSELARTLRTVQTHRAAHLPEMSRMPPAEQLVCEAASVAKSFEYARRELRL